ncbi:MAG TPA: hypothetical protein VN688_05245 [Gemmataceae bacterium]|nr:hypothetical protein [Gemmataceae bacterium]
MNLNGLNKRYDQRTAQERLTLLIAAGRRDDAYQHKRLVDSTRRRYGCTGCFATTPSCSVTPVEGRKRFCVDGPIAPEALLNYLPG